MICAKCVYAADNNLDKSYHCLFGDETRYCDCQHRVRKDLTVNDPVENLRRILRATEVESPEAVKLNC